MNRYGFSQRVIGLCLPVAIVFAAQSAFAGEKKTDFSKEIKPILAAHCTNCHGASKQEGGLRLDHRKTAIRGGDSGPLFVTGKSSKSELYRRIASKDESERMPPAEDGVKPLSEEQIALIKLWIDQGAVWTDDGTKLIVHSDHWAFQPVRRPNSPAVQNKTAIQNPIDNFVVAKLEAAKSTPSPPADRYTLIKRVYYDLLGLPPTLQAVDTFVNDSSPNAYEHLLDELLKSPHFGEHWGRHWLDKARYADSDGYEKDRPRMNAWRYRDWVIQAVNTDMPFDQFTVEQLAGDLLPNATAMDKLATAFHRQTLTNTEGGTDQEQFRVEAVIDRVNTTGTVWLGLTVGCAQCHSHKYDPIAQSEFYQLFAFYNNGDEANTEVSISAAAVKRYEIAKPVYDKRIAELRQRIANHKRELAKNVSQWEEQLQARLSQGAISSFYPIEVVKITSKNGSTFQKLDDGSYLVTGKNSDKDDYTLLAKLNVNEVAGFRIATLTDNSLPAKGPGRTAQGNFVLTELRVSASETKEIKSEHRVSVLRSRADFSQKGFSSAAATDGNDKTGWAVGSQLGKNHKAVFSFKQPLPMKTGWLQFVLSQQYGSRHTIGRFRIEVMTGLDLPDAVRTILAVAPEKRDEKQSTTLIDFYVAQQASYQQLEKQLTAIQHKAPPRPVMSVRVITQRSQNPRSTHILHRGDFLQPQAEVQPDTLAVLHRFKPRSQKAKPDRLDFANWLVDPANPLTPRVAVNDIWASLFGRGIVRTMEDFGARGDRPTHPQLLDWLADEYIKRGWSRKSLIKLIMMSATYRQSSHYRPEMSERDPQNDLLHRQNRFRVGAEIVRDIYLAASGLLSRKIGGPSVFPPMPADVAALSYANNFRWNTSKGGDRYRRGMYTFFKRTAPDPTLTMFDCPDSNTTNVRRTTSNTPLQALTTLNNIVFVESAQAMAKSALELPLKTDAARVANIFRRCVSRPPSDRETTYYIDLLDESRMWYKQHLDDAKKIVGDHQTKVVSVDEAAAWVATSRIIMNTDEFITRE